MNELSLREKLQSDNANTVISTLTGLKDTGTLSDIPHILPLTKSENVIAQKASITAICAIIREKLVSDFHELAPEIRKKLGALMGSLNPEIVKEISKDIFSTDENRRLRAVQTLGLLKKNPQIRTTLAKLVTDRDVKIRATAVNLLGKMIGPNDQEIILSLLNDEDKRVRANTVEALESLGNKRMMPILMRFRKDPSNRIRGNVLKALFFLGNVDIGNDIIDMLTINDNFMIASALWVVTQTKINTPVIEEKSGYFLISDNEMVRNNAKNALTALNTPRTSGYLAYLGDVYA